MMYHPLSGFPNRRKITQGMAAEIEAANANGIPILRVIRVKGFYKIPGTDTHKTPSPTTVYERT